MELNYCIYNGHIASLYEPFLSFNNRAFHLGDSVFESIRVFKGPHIPLLEKHIQRLKMAMTVFKMKIPPEFNSEYFRSLIHNLYEKNECKHDMRIRITVFRNKGGNYIPQTHEVSFLIEIFHLTDPSLELNSEGYWVELYTDCKKNINKYSNYKSGSAMFFVQAGIFCLSTGINECLIVNEKGNICESLHSNLFLIKDNFIQTPPLDEGCIDGVMRKTIMETAGENKFIVMEKPITMNHLYLADECFLTNAIQGIRWVYKFRDKFFFKNNTINLFEMLIKKLTPP